MKETETSERKTEGQFAAAHGSAAVWQPIETAPKDGTQILLYVPVLKRPVRSGHYYKSERYEHGKLESKSEGWTIYGDYFVTLEQTPPTHWMALPLPPNAGGER